MSSPKAEQIVDQIIVAYPHDAGGYPDASWSTLRRALEQAAQAGLDAGLSATVAKPAPVERSYPIIIASGACVGDVIGLRYGTSAAAVEREFLKDHPEYRKGEIRAQV